MDIIVFENKEFKIREIDLPDFGIVLISTNSLNELLLNENGNYTSEEAKIIDEKIFYFVDDSEIELVEEAIVNLITMEIK